MSEYNGIPAITGIGSQKQLIFSGKQPDFNVWYTRMLSYFAGFKLDKELDKEIPEAAANSIIYHCLVHVLDTKCLQIIRRSCVDDGKKAIGILKNKFMGTKQDIEVDLFFKLFDMKIEPNECPLELLSRIDEIKSGLEIANEKLSEMTDKLYTVSAMRALSDPKYEIFKSSITVHEKWLKWDEFQDLMKHQTDANLSATIDETSIILAASEKKKGFKKSNSYKSQFI